MIAARAMTILLALGLISLCAVAAAQESDWEGGYVQPVLENITEGDSAPSTELTESHYLQAAGVVIIFAVLGAFILIIKR